MDIHYCPQCGTATIKQEDGGRLRDTCPGCNWIHYTEIALGVGAIIPRGDAVLLVQRGIPPVGLWTLPSG
ncbi:MAG: NUDIX hydrolase, partial [Anaerolineae bacterium]|nr:NUDIX hydrolase [Anaerolineae bacterium]